MVSAQCSDLKAYIDLKYPSSSGQEEESKRGRKLPVRISRHKVCMDAGLGKLVSKVCITPKQLCRNLEGDKIFRPEDPAEEPAEYACDFVIDAEKHGFREVAAVLDGARQMAAKELAAEPFLRRYIREFYFNRSACLTAKITQKGETSADEYHREYDKYRDQPLREIEDEDFLWIMRAVRDGLLEVKVALPEDKQRKVLDEIFQSYKSDNSNPSAEEWNKFREVLPTMSCWTETYRASWSNVASCGLRADPEDSLSG